MGPVHFGDQPRKNYKTHSDEITVSFYTDLKKARISQKLHYERSPLCVKKQIQYFRCHDQIVWICIDSILYRNNFKYTYSLILIESLVSHPSLSDLQYLITDDSKKKMYLICLCQCICVTEDCDASVQFEMSGHNNCWWTLTLHGHSSCGWMSRFPETSPLTSSFVLLWKRPESTSEIPTSVTMLHPSYWFTLKGTKSPVESTQCYYYHSVAPCKKTKVHLFA